MKLDKWLSLHEIWVLQYFTKKKKKILFLVSHVSIDAHQSKEKVLGLQAVVHLLGGGARNQRSPLEKHQVSFTH